MNKDLEKYIGELSPESQEKARQCKTKEELNRFIADNDLEIPEDALEAVAGGCTSSGCNHNFIVIEDINMMRPWGVSGDVVRYNGVQVESIFTKQCSKCSELHYYYTPLPPMEPGYGVVESKEISLADYNSLKAQKTW